jgi:DNA-binding MurR/RpiR family transcriptional regulator
MKLIFTKEQTSKEFIKEMEEKHESIEQLEKKIEKSYNALDYVDLENWKYLLENPEETIKKTHTNVTNNIKTIDFELINIIKENNPKSLTELSTIMNKDISTIQRKVNKLKDYGFVELKEENLNNMKTPLIDYDTIEIAI